MKHNLLNYSFQSCIISRLSFQRNISLSISSSCLSLPFPLSKISPSLTFRFYHTRAQITRQLSRIWKLEMLSTNRHLKKFRMPEMGQRFSHFLGKNFFFKCLSFERWWEKIFYAWWNNVWCCKNSFGSRMSRERERERGREDIEVKRMKERKVERKRKDCRLNFCLMTFLHPSPPPSSLVPGKNLRKNLDEYFDRKSCRSVIAIHDSIF